jgi:glycogen phosphorylase
MEVVSTAQNDQVVAYFSMEICLEEALPTYSGGLGVLAGDTLRSAADLGVTMVGVTLLHRKGYFTQHLDQWGNQTESSVSWNPEKLLEPLEPRVKVEIAGREVVVRAWRYAVRGVRGHVVPVFLLDTDLPENSEYDRALTDTLYGGDSYYRLCQEIVLGMGGAQMLRALGHQGEIIHHINEGHASLLCLTLLERQLAGRGHWDIHEADLDAVRRQAVFTTHTPVPAGHDKFPIEMAREILGTERVALLESAGALENGQLNMTVVALELTRFCNAVALRHQEVSKEMFPDYHITAITNGVHATTWTSAPFQALFDRHIPSWREDNVYLRYASVIPLDEIREAHAEVKQELLDLVEKRSGVQLDAKILTIGFARRVATYKRADLIFTDPERLRAVTRHTGPIQIVYAGKAHPRDEFGKQLIKRIFDASRELGDRVRVVYLENYDMALGARLTAGVDVWLNNPLRPLEASGTSGMKAALNGVPSLSILDGWWVEGCVEGVTGWSIGDDYRLPQNPEQDVPELYHKLERVVLPTYYGTPYRFAEIMRNAISLNGCFFNTQRMVRQYVLNAYYPGGVAKEQPQAVVVK